MSHGDDDHDAPRSNEASDGQADDAASPAGFSELISEANEAGTRLDALLALRYPEYSRVQLRRAVTDGDVMVDGQRAKPSYRLRSGQIIRIVLPQSIKPGPAPEDIPLDILFEDEHLVVVNKPPGMVVHPSKGHWSGTLTAALAHHFESLSTIGGPKRPGIVHRLDRDTSGVLVVARTDQAHMKLAHQFAERAVSKEYLAIVVGVPDRDRDRVDRPIGAHPHHRERMTIREDHPTSRPAQTDWEVLQRFRGFALLLARPKTGRTHQIRVHLAHAGYPVLCDRLYGGRALINRGEILGLRTSGANDSNVLQRQALHSWRLALSHPITNQPMQWEAPLADDMQATLETLAAQGNSAR